MEKQSKMDKLTMDCYDFLCESKKRYFISQGEGNNDESSVDSNESVAESCESELITSDNYDESDDEIMPATPCEYPSVIPKELWLCNIQKMLQTILQKLNNIEETMRINIR